MNLRKFIGNKEFYKIVLAIALPIIIQNAITNFVNMLDNIMVGQIGTLPMSAVSISNQLLQVVNLAIIGSVNAVGIYGAQFFGKKDWKGVVDCTHIKLFVAVGFIALGILVFTIFGDPLLHLYMNEGTNTAAEIAQTMEYANTYLRLMMFGLIPFGLSMAIGTISREAGKTIINMYASIASVLVNFVMNYILIFGHFGFPQMGVAGAAVATIIARFVELGVVVGGLFHYRHEFTFLPDIFKGIRVPGKLLKSVIIKGFPLTVNEVLWSAGMAAISQCYSTRGLEAIAAVNITMTITNVFSIMCMAMGNSLSIIVGQRLGAGKIEEAKEYDTKMLATSVMANIIMGAFLVLLAPQFPAFYNTTDSVRTIATGMLRVAGVWLPMQAIYFGCYFTLRTGGKTVITFLFDSAYTCCISFPTAWALTHFTALPILLIYLLVTFADLPKVIIGLGLLKKGVWANNLVG